MQNGQLQDVDFIHEDAMIGLCMNNDHLLRQLENIKPHPQDVAFHEAGQAMKAAFAAVDMSDSSATTPTISSPEKGGASRG